MRDTRDCLGCRLPRRPFLCGKAGGRRRGPREGGILRCAQKQEAGGRVAPSRGGAGDGVREGAAPGTGAFAPWAHSFAGWAKEGQEAGRPGGSFARGVRKRGARRRGPGTGAFARSAKQEAEGRLAPSRGGWSWPYRGLKNLRKDMVRREISVFPVGTGNYFGLGRKYFYKLT